MKKPGHIKRFTIETERTFIFRNFGSQKTAWCVGCEAEAQLAPVPEAASKACSSELAIYRLLAQGVLHFTEDSEGRVLICLNSLLK